MGVTTRRRFLVALATVEELDAHVSVLRELARRGHQVELVFVSAGRTAGTLAHRLAGDHPGIVLHKPRKAADRDRSNLRAAAVEYGRMARQRSEGAAIATQRRRPHRASRDGWGPTALAAPYCGFLRRASQRRARWLAGRLIDVALSVDADEDLTAWLRRLGVDVLVCAPLVTPDVRELDLLCAAREAGIPAALLVSGVDQLEAAEAVSPLIDLALGWNESQRDSSVLRHGPRAGAVKVVGAAVSDAWYEAADRPPAPDGPLAFGMRPGLPYVLLQSSPSATPGAEVALVGALARELNGSAGIVVRPQPGTAERWESLPDTGRTHAVAWPSGTEGAETTLRDVSGCLSSAVGLIASDLLEAALLDLPCHAITSALQPSDAWLGDPAGGPIHFHDAVDGLRDLLVEAARGGANRRRADAVLRPLDPARPVAPFVADELERLAGLAVPALAPDGRLARTLLSAGAVLSSSAPRRAIARHTRASIGRKSRAAREQPSTVLFGPWNGGVLEELLYWIPWVRAAVAERAHDERVIVAHSGRDPRWYTPMSAATIIDAGDRSEAEMIAFLEEGSPAPIAHLDDGRVRKLVSAYRAGERGLQTVATWGGTRQIDAGPHTSEGVLAVTGDLLARRVESITLAFDVLRSPSADAVAPDWGKVTDGLAGASLVCTGALLPAALAVLLGVDTVLVLDERRAEHALAADVDVLDRTAAALGVELTVLSPAAMAVLSLEATG